MRKRRMSKLMERQRRSLQARRAGGGSHAPTDQARFSTIRPVKPAIGDLPRVCGHCADFAAHVPVGFRSGASRSAASRCNVCHEHRMDEAAMRKSCPMGSS